MDKSSIKTWLENGCVVDFTAVPKQYAIECSFKPLLSSCIWLEIEIFSRTNSYWRKLSTMHATRSKGKHDKSHLQNCLASILGRGVWYWCHCLIYHMCSTASLRHFEGPRETTRCGEGHLYGKMVFDWFYSYADFLWSLYPKLCINIYLLVSSFILDDRTIFCWLRAVAKQEELAKQRDGESWPNSQINVNIKYEPSKTSPSAKTRKASVQNQQCSLTKWFCAAGRWLSCSPP